MLSAWHSSGWQQNIAIPGRVSGSPTASDMAVSAMPVGTLGTHNLGLSATQQGAAAVEARVFHLLFCDGFTYYTAAPSFPKSCKVQYGMVFFGSSGRRLCIDPAYRAWFVDHDFVITAPKQRAWSTELSNRGIQHVRHTQTHYALPRHVQVSRQSAP